MAIPSFLNFLEESKQLDEAFNSSPYELTFGKKNAGDIFFTFVDEDEKEFRIQFYTPQGLGKNVRQVFIGQKRGSTYPDAIGRFKNPMRVIASMIEATKQFMATPLGKTIDGFAINFSKKALERGVTLLPKIIRQSGLKQKLNVMDLTYTPIPDRAFVWVVRKGKDPAQVFDGPKMKGVTWDDPDKVGDVPVQNNTPDMGVVAGSSEIEVNRDDNGWKLTKASRTQPMLVWSGKERGRTITANIAPHANEPGVYAGSIMNEKRIRAQSPDAIVRQLGLPQIPVNILNDFTKQSSIFWKDMTGDSGKIDMQTLPKTGSVDDLRNQGYIARLLGIVDTYAPQQVGMYAGEKLTRIGAGKYRTSGGLDIQVYFWGIVNGKLSVEVVSDLSGHDQLMLEGDVKNAAFEIVSAISRAADSQFNGEVECRVVPVNGAPYPIQKVSRSQGYSYVDCGSFVLKVSDALLERFTVGKAVELDLMREFPRTTFPVRYDWYGKTELVVKASDGKTIFGSINTNASDKDAVITANLKAPSNGTFFGETVHGFSIRWAVNFPETGKYAGTSMITNVTYYHDKGKVAFTPIISQKGRTLNNPKTYELPLNKDLVQSVIDEISSKMEYLSRNLQQLKSQTYNPNQVFLNDITITDKGEVIWNDYNLSDGKVTQIMLSMISAENKRLEKVTNKPDITLPKKQAEVVEFINRMIDIDLGPYLREPKKRDVVLFDSSELSINQLNNIERLGRETGKWSLQSNGGMGHALFLNVW
ncbi:hypothetical protein HYQ33_gp085 [Salmonella phage aagejoakim]|uniref:Uncharacterized protein n=1 Tax=Salmonella phage aagejoakim TaxID=2713273 RepID=A0A6G8RMT3_9CAUD|nr:hypothetical protein HYQ33_gp085 [Salmonella phage aagejoakim]QIO02683.1 hypothetical protein aagejoakim_85 [Salmonella phage aagejoakim]